MYYVIDKDDKLAIFDDNKEKLEATREFMPQLLGQYTLETDIVTAEELRQHPNKVIIDDVEIEIEVPDELNSLTVEQLNDSENDTNLSTVQPINYSTELEISTHTETRPVQQQVGSHTETITVKGLVPNPNWEKEELMRVKKAKNAENLTKAKAAVENGFVIYKNAEFETNAQTVGDLTATMLLMQAGSIETYNWLSRDDIEIELTVEDFAKLGELIAEHKKTVWNEKYLTYKNAIEKAKTVTAVEKVVINYENISNTNSN